MEKSWIDTEEGREALRELRDVPNVKRMLLEGGKKHTQSLVNRLLTQSLSDPSRDRSLLLTRAELDGAQAMLKFLVQLIDEAGRKKSP